MSTVTALLYRVSKEKTTLSTASFVREIFNFFQFKTYDGPAVTKFEGSLTSSLNKIFTNIVNAVNKVI